MKKYIAPELEIIVFTTEDVIATSGMVERAGDTELAAPAEWWN